VAGNGERSALRGSLWWHVRGETINPQMSSAADAIPLIALPLSGAQRTWRTCYWFAPVASDPSRHWERNLGVPAGFEPLAGSPMRIVEGGSAQSVRGFRIEKS